MGINRWRVVVAAAVAGTLCTVGITSASARNTPTITAGAAAVPANSVNSSSVVNGSLWAEDLNPEVVKWFTDQRPGENTVVSGSVVDGSIGQRDLYPSTVNWLRSTDDNSISESNLSAAVRDKLNASGPTGPKGDKGDTGETGPAGPPASDIKGGLTERFGVAPTAIETIGGSYAEATDLGEFQLEPGTYLINAWGFFNRLKTIEPDYLEPTTETRLQLTVRCIIGPEGSPIDVGTVITAPISPAGDIEATGTSVRVLDASLPTTCTVRGWGLNEDGTTFGSAGVEQAAQFKVMTTVAAVRVG